jgi:hypothetical protein
VGCKYGLYFILLLSFFERILWVFAMVMPLGEQPFGCLKQKGRTQREGSL